MSRPGAKRHKSDTSPETLSAVLAGLQGRSIVLVGLMGCGKTSVGKRLAGRLALPFIDADDEIEKAADTSISEIFSQYGEVFFRDGERRVIARLLADGQKVLATGGGAFMNEETRANIARYGVSIWLKADLPILMKRVMRRDNRPLLKAEDPEAVMRRLMTQRYPIYGAADITIQSREVPHDIIVAEAIACLAKHLDIDVPAPAAEGPADAAADPTEPS